jgi:hypothetical protein
MTTQILSRPTHTSTPQQKLTSRPKARVQTISMEFGLVVDKPSGFVLGRVFALNAPPIIPEGSQIIHRKAFRNGQSVFFRLPYSQLVSIANRPRHFGYRLNELCGNGYTTQRLANILEAHLEEFDQQINAVTNASTKADLTAFADLYNLNPGVHLRVQELREYLLAKLNIQKEGVIIHPENLK